MKKLYLLVLYLSVCWAFNTTQAQVAYPYFPADSTRQDLTPVAITVLVPLTYVVNQANNFTLEGQSTAGVAIQIANGTTAYNYTPVATTTVRFVKRGTTVYVYENTVYKATVAQTAQTGTGGITGLTGTVLHVETSGLGPVINPDYTNGDYVEATTAITNPNFESQLTGWTTIGMVAQGNNSFDPLKSGSLYVEKYVNTAPLPDASIVQSVLGLPNGLYILKAAGQNILQPSTGKSGAYFFGNTTKKAVTDKNEYSFSFLVVNGKADIGFKLESSQANWAALDNYRLQYKGFPVQSIKDSLQVLKDSATNLLNKKMQNPVRLALVSAANTAQQAINNASISNNDLSAAFSQLQIAVSNALVSISAYSGLQVALDSATVVYGTGTGIRADSLQAAIQRNQAVSNNLDASLASIYASRDDLYRAIFAYRLANASGPAPTVVTSPSFTRGATRIFGRSTVSGVATSAILETGFCWSTSPLPLVTDNRTTKTFSNNGLIYRIENLQPSTVYYIRAYALTQNYAVGYGDVVKAITIPKGTITFQLNGSVTNSPGNFERIQAAITSGVDYYNNLTSIQGHRLSVNYNAGTPTAEGSYGGYMQFGANPSYQQTGTAMHEMNHTVGVGQHYIWYGPNSPLRGDGSRGTWLGERANNVLRFLNNDPQAILFGDAIHMYSYGINGASEDNGSEFLYTANSLLTQGLGEDGLPPTGGFTTPAYTFNQVDTAKYYIKTEDENAGRDIAFLAENASGQLYNKIINATNVLANDSAAWYLTFNPATGYYRIKNVATGKYFSYQTTGQNGITLAAATTPTDANSFQLMNTRYTTRLTKGTSSVSVKAYWIVRPQTNTNPPTLSANTNGSTSAVTFDLRDVSIPQHWLILNRLQVDSFKSVEGDNMPLLKSPRAASGDARSTITWGKQFGIQYAVLRSATQTGTFDTLASSITAARYIDNGLTNGTSYYYKLVAYNELGSLTSPVLSTMPTPGQYVYVNFNDTATTLGEDKWGGYHATFAATAAKDSNSVGKFLKLNGTATSYASMGEGTVSDLNNFTIASWFKLSTLDGYMRVFDFGSGTNNYLFLTPTYYSNGSVSIFYGIKNGGPEQALAYQYTVPANIWTHVAVTQSNDSTKLFINGVQVASTAGITLRPSNLGVTTQNYLGKSQFNDPVLNGFIDEFRIYNYAMDSTGIKGLFGIAPLAAPSAVIAPRVASGDGRTTLVWNYQIDATYNILRATTATGTYDTIATKVNALRYVDGSRTNNTDYYYKIVATNIAGNGPVTTAIAAKPTVGRQAYLNFNDVGNTTSAEESWNAYDATLAAGASREAGKEGSALKLTGASTSFATLSGNPVSELSNFTISTWVKMNSFSNWMRVFDIGTGTNQYMFLTVQGQTTNGQSNVRYAIKNGGGEQIVNYPYTIPLNTWVHYVVTQTGTTAKLYINGMPVASNTSVTIKPSDLGATTQNYLGKAQYNDPLLNGSIDEFRIYNYGMTDQQVSDLYAGPILPLKLISFEGKPTPAGNVLNWKVITDPETLQIQLQKSADSRNFTSIHEVAATRSNREQLFSYTDAGAKEPVAYYRLKMTDQNGKVVYSPIIAITTAIKGTEIVGLYPSIVTTTASLSVAAAKATTLTVVVSDMQGHMLQSSKRTLVAGSNLLPIDASGLAAGSYSISVFENDTRIPTSVRFVVSR